MVAVGAEHVSALIRRIVFLEEQAVLQTDSQCQQGDDGDHEVVTEMQALQHGTGFREAEYGV